MRRMGEQHFRNVVFPGSVIPGPDPTVIWPQRLERSFVHALSALCPPQDICGYKPLLHTRTPTILCNVDAFVSMNY